METKKKTGAKRVIALMSGNYVQRGTPAIMDKKIRAHAALLCGVDLVIELPLFAAASSAPDFAMGAVALLDKLGVVDYLSFGSECQEINKLKAIASFLIKYENEIESGIKDLMSLGHSYPKAKELYLTTHLKDASMIQILKQPNNILGIDPSQQFYNTGLRRTNCKRPSQHRSDTIDLFCDIDPQYTRAKSDRTIIFKSP